MFFDIRHHGMYDHCLCMKCWTVGAPMDIIIITDIGEGGTVADTAHSMLRELRIPWICMDHGIIVVYWYWYGTLRGYFFCGWNMKGYWYSR